MNRYPKTLFVSIVLEALVLLTAQSVYSQTWSNRYSYSDQVNTFCSFRSINTLNDNQLIIHGNEYFQDEGWFTSIYRIDQSGIQVDQELYGVQGENRVDGWNGSSAILPNNELLICGGISYWLDEDGYEIPSEEIEVKGYLSRWNLDNLSLIEERTYSNSLGFCSIRQVSTEDSIVVAGQIQTSATENHVWIAGLDEDFNITSEFDLRNEVTLSYSDINSLAKLSDSFLIGGFKLNNQNEASPILYQLHSDGTFTNHEDLIPPGNFKECTHLLKISNRIIIAFIEIITVEDIDKELITLVCLDDNLEYQWQLTIDDPNIMSSSILSLKEGLNDCFIGTGVVTGNDLNALSAGFVVNVSSSGELLWTRKIENSSNGLNYFFGVSRIAEDKIGLVGNSLDVPGDPFPGQQDAWVTVTDEFGCIISGCEVGVPELLKSSELSVYPNPASSNLTIEFSDNDFFKGSLEIYSITGALIHSQIINQSRVELSVQDWDEGLYFIQVKTSQGVRNKKIVVE